MNIYVKKFLKRLLKYRLTGQFKSFKLTNTIPNPNKTINRIGLYLHIPFCKNLCPYCPYNKIEFDEAKARRYEKAVFKEIDMFEERLKDKPMGSLYIGGGTPTTMLRGLLNIIDYLKRKFNTLRNDICIELAPNDMSQEVLEQLKNAGVTMISIGVESFNDRLNQKLGRKMEGKIIYDSVVRAMTIGFDSVNVDLMFVLPTQTFEELRKDVRTAVECGVHQISAYPLFAFPYTELGKEMKIQNVTRPPGRVIRRMLAIIEQECLNNGYVRCAVWSFIKKEYKKFSSVSRHYYKGFGASSGSMLGDSFYVNTFNVDEYCKTLENNKEPIALSMPFNTRQEMAYWLYWRIYEMYINRDEFSSLFNKDFNKIYGDIFSFLKLIGFATEDKEKIFITGKGSYWVHRVQNEFSLSNIQKIWGTCIFNPWPKEIRF
ncbi:MAG: radical SAM protein [Candidatus Omnitrophota bacterium]|nr:MAG: radical SAM protein [Candidatus Omnitrophota bacterium]